MTHIKEGNEKVEQIKNSIMDSINSGRYSNVIVMDAAREYERICEPACLAPGPMIQFWEDRKAEILEMAEEARNEELRRAQIAAEFAAWHEKSYGIEQQFLHSQEFKDFTKNQAREKKQFLEKNPNYQLVQTIKVTPIGSHKRNNFVFYNTIDKVKSIQTKKALYRELRYATRIEWRYEHGYKSHHYVPVEVKVPYDANPYKDVKCFFDYDGRQIICEKYADPNQ